MNSDHDVDPVKLDPDVIAAEQRRDQAREVFDLADAVWKPCLRAHFNAEMAGLAWDQRIPLKRALDEAARHRDAAGQKLVDANMAILAAHRAARWRLALAERS
jgi:hypothetical protein